MPQQPYRVALTDLPEHPVSHADVVLRYDLGGRYWFAALDCERGECVRLPWFSDDVGWNMLALSPDGTHAVMINDTRFHRVWLCELATGHLRWYALEGRAEEAAVSPDGRQLATLVGMADPQHPDDIEAGLEVLGVTDLATGQLRRIWQQPGGVAENTVCWSPDGQLIAATYLGSVDTSSSDEHVSVVVTPAGTVVAHLEYTCLVPSSGTAWLADRQLLCRDETEMYSKLTILDVDSGARHVPGEVNSYPLLRFGDRLVITSPHKTDGWETFDTIGLDGTQRQPWLLVTPPKAPRLYQRPAPST